MLSSSCSALKMRTSFSAYTFFNDCMGSELLRFGCIPPGSLHSNVYFIVNHVNSLSFGNQVFRPAQRGRALESETRSMQSKDLEMLTVLLLAPTPKARRNGSASSSSVCSSSSAARPPCCWWPCSHRRWAGWLTPALALGVLRRGAPGTHVFFPRVSVGLPCLLWG